MFFGESSLVQTKESKNAPSKYIFIGIEACILQCYYLA